MPAVVVGMIGMDCIGRVSLLVTCQLIGGIRLLVVVMHKMMLMLMLLYLMLMLQHLMLMLQHLMLMLQYLMLMLQHLMLMLQHLVLMLDKTLVERFPSSSPASSLVG